MERPFVNGTHREVVRRQILLQQRRLRAFVRCLLVRNCDMDDVLQEINLVLWEKAEEFRPGTDFWAWASQIARFKVANQLRKYGSERLVFDADTLERIAVLSGARIAALDQRRQALQECLNRLPQTQRQLLDLRYASEDGVEKIAQSIGRPPGSVRQTLYRIRAALPGWARDGSIADPRPDKRGSARLAAGRRPSAPSSISPSSRAPKWSRCRSRREK